jgi:prophage regulatory protein
MNTQEAKTRILRRPVIEEITGLKRSTIYAAIAAGTFPKPIHLGPRAVGWLETDIDQWLADRVAASRVPERTARP